MEIVEIEEGRKEPMPSYVSDFAIADKLGIPVTDIESVDAYWIGAALAMIEAKRIYDEETERRKD